MALGMQLHQVKEMKTMNGPVFNPQATLSALAGGTSNQNQIRQAMVRINAIYSGRTMEDQLESLGTKYLDSLDDQYYDIVESARRNVRLVEATDENGVVIKSTDQAVGKGGKRFCLYFSDDLFFEGETIVGEKNEKYPVKVLKKQAHGTSLVKYTCEMFGRTGGMPGAELQPEKKFSKEYAAVEFGLSRQVGGISRASTARMKVFLSALRIDDKVPGDLDDYAVAFGLPAAGKDGVIQTFTALSTQTDWLVEQEFAMYKHNALAYGVTTVDENGQISNKGVSGRSIKFGSGLRELTEQTNKLYFNFFSLDLLEDALETISYGTTRIQDKNFTITTGMGGAKLFHKAVLDRVSGWQTIPTNNNPAVITKVNSELHDNALSAGYQFVQYKSANGLTVTIEINSSYDDPVRNKILMPGTSLPAESFRMDIVYKGSAENPNVQKLGLKKLESIGGEYRGYSSGFRNPLTGQVNVNFMASDEDAATITKFTYLGIAMYDVNKSLSLIPEVLM